MWPAAPSTLVSSARVAVRARDCSVSLRAVERAVGRHQVEFDALSGPWPDALDPSGELGMVAAGLVPQLAEQIVAPSAV